MPTMPARVPLLGSGLVGQAQPLGRTALEVAPCLLVAGLRGGPAPSGDHLHAGAEVPARGLESRR
ncbi:hypothetical protein ACF1FE_05025 [Streptomyces griseofuscus]|uniref:hypothetical protein n=1 Tax=Streptomyces griseofuscus TaxID=146922 RepID=UPI0036FDB18C